MGIDNSNVNNFRKSGVSKKALKYSKIFTKKKKRRNNFNWKENEVTNSPDFLMVDNQILFFQTNNLQSLDIPAISIVKQQRSVSKTKRSSSGILMIYHVRIM